MGGSVLSHGVRGNLSALQKTSQLATGTKSAKAVPG
jgi:hypothetical protein